MQVLIVEDDFISRRLLNRYLDSMGSCDMAVNGEEALAAVRSTLARGEHYDLVCLDIMLPGISGQGTLAGIRELEDQYEIPPAQRCKIVMTSALDQQEVIERSRASRADDYVVKPIIKRNFLSVLERLGLLGKDHRACV